MLNNIIVKVQKTIPSEVEQQKIVRALQSNLNGKPFGELKMIALLPVNQIIAQYAA